MRKGPPGQNIPIQLPDGSIEPLWYEFLTRGVLNMADVDNTTAITGGQVLIWDATVKKFKPGAN